MSDVSTVRARRRPLAAALAIVMAVSGAVALAPAPAVAAYPGTFDPFAISGGFTVYAREDATLGNTETEGSIAVGGTLTKPGDGQYTLVHVVAGTGDYSLPVVDGDPTRLLAGSFSPASGGITAITSAGTSDPALLGDLKLVERDGPFQAFARADWLRLNTNPANVDQTPLIDATHQKYPADAVPPASVSGNGSIYTVDTSATAVADYVEANREASYEQAAQCFADIADPLQGVGYPVAVADDVRPGRVVLAPLSADKPNVVDYDDIAGAALIQFSDGPQPGVQNPLVIRLPAGTTSVVGARTDPQGAYSPYIVWDLSAVTGDVTVTAAEGRIDGSIYAPDADVTVDAAPLDGQIIGRDVTTLGGEVHSFLFAGQLSCTSDSGTFRIRKAIDGIAADDSRLDGLLFTVNYVATLPEGAVSTGSLVLPASGDWVLPGEDFPTGTTIAFSEVTPPTVPGYDWGTPTITPNPVVIGAGTTADVTVTNTATQPRGTFTIRKEIETTDPAVTPPPLTGTVPVTWVARYRGLQIAAGDLDVPLDGTPISAGEDFPIGTVVLLQEDLTAVAPPAGFHWAGAAWNPGRRVVISDAASGSVSITLTNVLAPDAADRTVTIVKQVIGTDAAYDYEVSYNSDPVPPATEARSTVTVPVGDPVALDDVETGTDVLQLAELVPTLGGSPVDVTDWENPVFRVMEGSTELGVYDTGGFEGAVPLDQAIADIALPPTGDIVIHVENVRKSGSFTLSKRLEGITVGELPSGTGFHVTWTATTPEGDVSTGTLRLPADGTPVSPVDEAGVPLQFPYGTTVDFEEQVSPTLRSVTWQDATFAPDQVTIGASDAATIAVVVTNTAIASTGTFLVSKRLVGIAADDLGVDTLRVLYLALPPGGGWQVGEFSLPTDGTPAGPVDAGGAPVRFAIGTRILLAEDPPTDDVLPENFEWAFPTWSPSRLLTIGDAVEPVRATVTNTAVEYARVSLRKIVDAGTGAFPADASFTVDWWLDSEPQPALVLTDGQTVSSDRFPVGSIIEATEPAPTVVPGGEWQTPTWTLNGEELPIEANGRVVVPVSSRGDADIAIELVNAWGTTPTPSPTPSPTTPGNLPTTGGEFSPALPLAAFAAVLLGALLLSTRRRRTG